MIDSKKDAILVFLGTNSPNGAHLKRKPEPFGSAQVKQLSRTPRFVIYVDIYQKIGKFKRKVSKGKKSEGEVDGCKRRRRDLCRPPRIGAR